MAFSGCTDATGPPELTENDAASLFVPPDGIDAGPCALNDPRTAPWPIHYWSFEETDTAEIIDAVGGLDPASGDATTGAMGVVEHALELDGASQHLTFGDVLDMGAHGFALQAWVRTSSSDGDVSAGTTAGRIAGKGATPGESDPGYFLRLREGELELMARDGTNEVRVATVEPSSGSWHQVVGVVDRGNQEARLYVDGEPVDRTPLPDAFDSVDNPLPLTFGAFDDGQANGQDEWLEGRLDEVGFFGRALDDCQVAAIHQVVLEGQPSSKIPLPDQIFPADPPTLARLELDGDARDSSGKGRHGELRSSGDDFVASDFGQALALAGTGVQGIDWSEHADALTAPFTLEMVLRLDHTTDSGPVARFDATAEEGWYVDRGALTDGPRTRRLADGFVQAGSLQYLAWVVKKDGSADVFRNGSHVGSLPTGFSLPPAVVHLIGGNGSEPQMAGELDAVRLSAGARTAAELRSVGFRLGMPQLQNDEIAVTAGQERPLHLLDNDTHPEGDPLRVLGVSGGTGRVRITPAGAVGYTATDDGDLRYTVTDGRVSSGMAFRLFGSSSEIRSVDDAEEIIASGSPVRTGRILTLNLGSDGGHFSNDAYFPGDLEDRFVLEVTGVLFIPAAGHYTFGVNSDDGFSMRIEGATVTGVVGGAILATDTFAHPMVRVSEDTLAKCQFSAPGFHPFRLVYYEDTHGEVLELFAAHGAHTSFSGDFQLVGNGSVAAFVSEPAGHLAHANARVRALP